MWIPNALFKPVSKFNERWDSDVLWPKLTHGVLNITDRILMHGSPVVKWQLAPEYF